MSSTLPLDTQSANLTTLTVKVDGQPLPDTISILILDVSRELNRIPLAVLVVDDGDPAKQDFEVSSADHLIPGKVVEILGGYESDEQVLFKGVITAQRIQVQRSGGSLLRIEARDAAFRMTLDRKSRYFADLSDSDVFEALIGAYADLTAQVEPTTPVYPRAVQYQVADWDFLVSRAEQIGLYCLANNGTLQVAKPDFQQQPALTLAYGSNVFDADLVLDGRTQPGNVTTLAWDPANQQVLTATIDDVATPSQGNINAQQLADVSQVDSYELRHSGTLQQQELDAWAAAALLKYRLTRIRGTVRFQGSHLVAPGSLVALEGLGDRFNGTAFVTGVRHVLGDGDWETTVQIGLQPEWHVEMFGGCAGSPPGFHWPIHGLYVGQVTQLEQDPDGEDRIRVRLPLINADDEGVWSRLATLDAGSQRGTVFRPEIDDEVIVGFVSNDPHQPVVLGMLHSSSKPAPIAASDDNHQKGLVTRSGMKVMFDDDATTVTIETPNGNKVLLDDSAGSITVTDETGSSVTMDSNGITLDSAADLILKAKKDISLEGVNINVKASSALKAEGSTGASVKSGGNTEIKGSLVQIN